LTAEANEYACDESGCSWGSFTGSGLEPGSTVEIYISFNGGAFGDSGDAQVSVDGTASVEASLTCNTTPEEIYATGTTAVGNLIISNTVSSPCAQ
jgi:hypothetical protein